MPRLFRWNASRIADSANGKWLSIGTTQPAACNNELPHQSTRTKSINSKWNTNKAQQSNREQNKKIEHIMSGERLGYKPIRLTWDYTGKWGTIWYRTSIWFVCVCVLAEPGTNPRTEHRDGSPNYYSIDWIFLCNMNAQEQLIFNLCDCETTLSTGSIVSWPGPAECVP